MAEAMIRGVADGALGSVADVKNRCAKTPEAAAPLHAELEERVDMANRGREREGKARSTVDEMDKDKWRSK
jgi:hypothetical protein